MLKNLDETARLQPVNRVDARSKRRETITDCRRKEYWQYCNPPGQLIGFVYISYKLVIGGPVWPDKKEIGHFLTDVPQRGRYKEEQGRGKCSKDSTRV